MSDIVSPASGVATIRYVSDEQGPAYPLYQRVLREKSLRGWTWTQLQQETGIGRSTFNSWKTQPQPPVPRTVNGVADKLGIKRREALRLAGILDGDESDLRPECYVEQVIMDAPGDADLKREIVMDHRRRGHTERCGPFAAPDALSALGAEAAAG